MAFIAHEAGIEGQYIVDIRLIGVPPEDKDAAIEARVAELVGRHGGEVLYIYRNTVPGYLARMTEEQARALAEDPDVGSVEQDQHAALANVTSWGLDRIDQKPAGPPLDQSYSPPNHGKGVRVYVIDTGVDAGHPEFGSRVQKGFSVFKGDMATNDCDGHGTTVAGVIGSIHYGVANEVDIVPVKVWCGHVGGAGFMASGVDWVTGQAAGPRVANISMVVPHCKALNARIKVSVSAGITYTVAAGNSNDNACKWSPASSKLVLAVGASTIADTRMPHTNFGPCVQVFAPGLTIASTCIGNQICYGSGTSMAAPHVAGAAAIYLSVNPQANPSTVKAAILGAALPNVLKNVAGSKNLLLNLSNLF